MTKDENNHPEMTKSMKKELRALTLRQKESDIKFHNNCVRLDPEMADNCSKNEEGDFNIPSLPKLDEPTICLKKDNIISDQTIYYDKEILQDELDIKYDWVNKELRRIWMYVAEGFTQVEIAEKEGKPVLWVKRRIKKLRELVREKSNLSA